MTAITANKRTSASVTSNLSSENFLRWISKKYFTRVSVIFSSGPVFSIDNFRKLGDTRYYSQTLQFCVVITMA